MGRLLIAHKTAQDHWTLEKAGLALHKTFFYLMICKIIFQSHISSFQEHVKTNVYAIEVSEGIEHHGGDFSGDYSDRKSHKNTCRSQKCKRRTGLGVKALSMQELKA